MCRESQANLDRITLLRREHGSAQALLKHIQHPERGHGTGPPVEMNHSFVPPLRLLPERSVFFDFIRRDMARVREALASTQDWMRDRSPVLRMYLSRLQKLELLAQGQYPLPGFWHIQRE